MEKIENSLHDQIPKEPIVSEALVVYSPNKRYAH
jgi:hypothetical protein